MPTPILIDGFEHQTLSANAFGGTTEGLWSSTTGTPTFPSGRNGVCLQCAGAGTAVNATKRLAGDPTIAVISYYYRLVSGSGGTTFFATTTPGFNACARLYVQSGGTPKLGLQVGGAGPTYEGPNLSDAAWHRIDMKIDVSADPWTVTWKIDGTDMTTVQWSTGAQAVRFLRFGTEGSETRTDQFDDLVVSVTSGDYPLGDHDVLYGIPNADGTHNAGTNVMERPSGVDIDAVTTAWTELVDWPTSGTGTDHVQQSAIGASNYAEVTFADQPAGKTIWGVEGIAALWASGVNANNGTTRILDGSSNTLTDIYSGDMSETSVHYRRAIITAPGGGWDGAGYQGVKARIGFSTDVTDIPRWEGLMLQYAVTSSTGGVNITPSTVVGTASVPTPTVTGAAAPLVPVVATQFTDAVDRTAYTTGSLTPTSGALYLAFVVGRTADVAYRIPTLTGTNGWDVPWTRIPASQAIYRFTSVDRGGVDVFWGIASSAVAGTLTFDYGAGTSLRAGVLHLIRIDGGPNLSSPIGATATNHIDVATGAVINATLSATPATSSVVVACCMSDLNSGSMTPSTGYANLGSMQNPVNTGISQPMYDEAPTLTTLGTTFSGNDIMALAAVEVRKATTGPFPVVAAVNYSEETVDTTTHDVLLPAGISAGDRLILFSVWDGNTATQSGMPAGWTKIAGLAFAGGISCAVWEKINCTGFETNFTYTTSAAEQSANRTWRITGSHLTQPAETGVDIAGTASSFNADDPVPSWGAADTLWAVFAAIDGSISVSSYPANYTSNQFTDNTGNTTAGVGLAVCSRNLNAIIDTPGNLVVSASTAYITYQFAIRPAAAAIPVPKILKPRFIKSAAVQNRASRW